MITNRGGSGGGCFEVMIMGGGSISSMLVIGSVSDKVNTIDEGVEQIGSTTGSSESSCDNDSAIIGSWVEPEGSTRRLSFPKDGVGDVIVLLFDGVSCGDETTVTLTGISNVEW